MDKIKETTVNFLEASEYVDIENIDSLKMIRSVFSVIKVEYKRQQQKIASIKRQIQEDPSKFQAFLDEQKKEEEGEKKEEPAEPKPEEPVAEGDGEASEKKSVAPSEPKAPEKRPPTDK